MAVSTWPRCQLRRCSGDSGLDHSDALVRVGDAQLVASTDPEAHLGRDQHRCKEADGQRGRPGEQIQSASAKSLGVTIGAIYGTVRYNLPDPGILTSSRLGRNSHTAQSPALRGRRVRPYRSAALRFALVAASLSTGCSGERASAERHQGTPDTAVTASSDSARIVNRAWQVASSTAGEPGQLYTFLSDGTLLIASAHGTPYVGSWSYAPGKLTFVEESPAFTLDIERATADTFRVKGTTRGGTLEIVFVPARPGRVR
jgi:hypothetical protein